MLSYKEYLYQYGVITLILLLKYFENKEMFEECVKIIETIREEERVLKAELGTKLTSELIEKIYEMRKESFRDSGEMMERYRGYALIIIEEKKFDKILG